MTEVDLRDFKFMPLHIERLRRSKSWLACKALPELAFYMINLWMRAWHEVPAGSIEDDDAVLADAAMCAPKQWQKVKERVLRGWNKGAEGRLYNSTVMELGLEAWTEKQAYRKRAAAAREAKAQRRNGSNIDAYIEHEIEAVLGSKSVLDKSDKSDPKTAPLTGLKGKGQLSRQGSKNNPDPSLESNNSQQQQPYDPAAAAASKSDFSDEKRRCEEAANAEYPGFGVIEGLIEEGFDFERRILPIIRDLAEKARGPCRDPIHAWAYFAKAIRDTGQVVRRSPEEANRPSEQLLFFEENSREFAALTTGPKGSFYSSVVTKNPDTGKRGVYCRREAAPPPADGRVA